MLKVSCRNDFLTQLQPSFHLYGELFRLDDVYYRITSKTEGMSKSLDVINDGNNNALQLSETGDYSGQYWRITEIE